MYIAPALLKHFPYYWTFEGNPPVTQWWISLQRANNADFETINNGCVALIMRGYPYVRRRMLCQKYHQIYQRFGMAYNQRDRYIFPHRNVCVRDSMQNGALWRRVKWIPLWIISTYPLYLHTYVNKTIMIKHNVAPNVLVKRVATCDRTNNLPTQAVAPIVSNSLTNALQRVATNNCKIVAMIRELKLGQYAMPDIREN